MDVQVFLNGALLLISEFPLSYVLEDGEVKGLHVALALDFVQKRVKLWKLVVYSQVNEEALQVVFFHLIQKTLAEGGV